MYNRRKKSKLEYKKWLYSFIYKGLCEFIKVIFCVVCAVWFVYTIIWSCCVIVLVVCIMWELCEYMIKLIDNCAIICVIVCCCGLSVEVVCLIVLVV